MSQTPRRTTPSAKAASGQQPAKTRPHRLAAPCGALAWLLAAGAQAQTPACDQLKDTLAARVNADRRGLTLETVSADTPVPPGARVIGNCEAGAYKIILLRGGNTLPASGAASAAEPASAPQAMAVTARRSPDGQADRAVPPVPASAPSPTPVSVARSVEAASVPATPAAAHETSQATATTTTPAQRQPDETPGATLSLEQQAFELLARYWQWGVLLLGLPLVAWLWARVAHHRAYDAAGLPRGPRLN
jgi:hypothetical protein